MKYILKKLSFINWNDEYQRIEKIKNTNYKKLFDTVSNINREILGDKNALLNGSPSSHYKSH